MHNDYSIAEEYTLPSLGKVYKNQINPNVKLRSMTTQDELKRLAPSDRPYKILSEIIDDCILTDVGMSVYDMCLPDYQFLLHKLRIVTYGADYPSISTCPFCGNASEIGFKLDELEVVTFDETKFSDILTFKLPKTGKEITVKLQTPRMLDEVNLRVKEVKKKAKNSLEEDIFYLNTLINIIDLVDGEKLDPIKKEQMVRALPMMDTNYIVKHAQKLEESFGIKSGVPTHCDVCGLDYNTNFRITSEFFGPSINI